MFEGDEAVGLESVSDACFDAYYVLPGCVRNGAKCPDERLRRPCC